MICYDFVARLGRSAQVSQRANFQKVNKLCRFAAVLSILFILLKIHSNQIFIWKIVRNRQKSPKLIQNICRQRKQIFFWKIARNRRNAFGQNSVSRSLHQLILVSVDILELFASLFFLLQHINLGLKECRTTKKRKRLQQLMAPPRPPPPQKKKEKSFLVTLTSGNIFVNKKSK
jgi:hypothetical protein